MYKGRPRGLPILADGPVLVEDSAMDFAAAGLLDGLEGQERKARVQLLERLAAEGVSLQELKDAVKEERLALLPVERLLGGRYTAKEVEQRTGVPAELVLRVRRLLGLPDARADDRVFSEEEVESAQSARLFLEAGLSEESVLEMTRVLGEGMARLAATSAAAFVEAFLEPGDSEQDVAQRFTTLAEQLTPAIRPVLFAAYSSHLRESVRRGMIGRAERQTGRLPGEEDITVCFADLVGFTRLGSELETAELSSVAGRLAELASDAIEPPVRLVKTIGDAAMFVSPEPGPLVAVALSLLEAVEEAELPSLRAGIASGMALQRAGDFYGHTVNLASRVTGIARPASVLCTQEVRDAAPEEFSWSSAGRHRLKGLGETVPLHRARRVQAGSEDTHERSARKRRADPRRTRASR